MLIETVKLWVSCIWHLQAPKILILKQSALILNHNDQNLGPVGQCPCKTEINQWSWTNPETRDKRLKTGIVVDKRLVTLLKGLYL